MGTVVEIFMMAVFCLIAGYLLGYLQRALVQLEKCSAYLEMMATQTANLMAPNTPPEQGALPIGLYALGQSDPNTGLTPLQALTQNNRS